jgi:hypothetical protein
LKIFRRRAVTPSDQLIQPIHAMAPPRYQDGADV